MRSNKINTGFNNRSPEHFFVIILPVLPETVETLTPEQSYNMFSRLLTMYSVKILLSLSLVLFFCEYLVYFIVLYQCSWPLLNNYASPEGQLRVAFLADTHLLGVRNGHWFDKLRREWQMYRSFQTFIVLHKPDIVFILGDIFDEGSFSSDDVFMSYVDRFFQLFKVPEKLEMFVVAGNHDIGFHYAMHPYLEHRFSETLKAPSVRLVTRRNIHFILINSMALEKDGCSICRTAERNILQLRDEFRCANGTGVCHRGMKLRRYSRPVLLLHFPLYRKNDAICDEGIDEINQPAFKEKWDCLSEEASEFLLDELNPRAIFTGHTHQQCRRMHRNNIYEFTVSSFNWRNTPNPSFLMAIFNEKQYDVHLCHLPHEYLIIGLYGVFFMAIMFKSCVRIGEKCIRGRRQLIYTR